MATGGRRYQITKSAIQKHWAFIKQSVSFDDLADHMFQEHIITSNDHRKFNYEIKCQDEKMNRLLYIIFKGNEEVLQKFAQALEATEYFYVLDVLEGKSDPPVTRLERREHAQEETDTQITMTNLQFVLDAAFEKQAGHIETVVSHTVSRQIAILQKEIKDRIEEENIEVQKLEEQLQSEKTQNKITKLDLDKMSKECKKLQQDNAFLKAQVEAWSKDAKSTDETVQLKKECSHLEQKLEELKSQIKNYKKKDSENMDQIKTLNEDVAKTEKKINQMKETLKLQNSKIEEERRKHMEIINENEKQIKALKDTIEAMKENKTNS